LVGPDEGGIEHHILVPGIVHESSEYPLPDPRLRPAGEALVHALVLAASLGQLVPLRPRSQDPEHAVDEHAVVLCGSARIGLLARQHLSDTLPLLVVELVSLRHALSSESMDPENNES